jgi:regulator of protease activity HflC (stomatin/prohibitin superfamily)
VIPAVQEAGLEIRLNVLNTFQNVGIRDIIIPQKLADAMSKQAQAQRERQARVILGTAETEIFEKFAEASKQYINNPVAS